jgi:hypothetical protein
MGYESMTVRVPNMEGSLWRNEDIQGGPQTDDATGQACVMLKIRTCILEELVRMSAGISVALTAGFRSFPQTDQTNSEDVHWLDSLTSGSFWIQYSRTILSFDTIQKSLAVANHRRSNMPTPFNLIILSSNRRLLPAGYLLVYYSTLKMEARTSSEQSVSVCKRTQSPVP